MHRKYAGGGGGDRTNRHGQESSLRHTYSKRPPLSVSGTLTLGSGPVPPQGCTSSLREPPRSLSGTRGMVQGTLRNLSRRGEDQGFSGTLILLRPPYWSPQHIIVSGSPRPWPPVCLDLYSETGTLSRTTGTSTSLTAGTHCHTTTANVLLTR